MKMQLISLKATAMASLGILLTGCMTARDGVVLDPVGPAPGGAVAAATDGNGTLLVYSARDVMPDFNRRDPYRAEYSDYQILTESGNRLQFVHNDTGSILQRPRAVALSPGQYRVMAQANGYGTVTVPVVIKSGQETVMHLEGSVNWGSQMASTPAETVRLPGGEIVGWKAGLASSN